MWRSNTHHNGTTVNWLPCAQVSKDNGPAIMVTPTNTPTTRTINRGLIGERNLNPQAGSTSFR